MALKIWNNGVMQKINTNLHKPVIFLNGTKYKLDKAYTFVNGVKQQIWGETGVSIDYISSTGVFSGGYVFAVGEDWLNVFNNNVVYRINITNLANPTLIQNVTWGNVRCCNCYAGGATQTFEAWNGTSKNAYKLVLTPSTGVITVGTTFNLSSLGSALFAFTNSACVSAKSSMVGGSISSPIYEQSFYFNNTNAFTDAYTSLLMRPAIQISDNAVLGMKAVSKYTNSYLWYKITSTGKTSAGSSYGSLYSVDATTGRSWVNCFYFDGNIYFKGLISNTPADGSIIGMCDASSTESVLYTYSAAGKNLKLLGEINGLIYVIEYPQTIDSSNIVNLVLLSATDLSVVLTKTLVNDPFEENNGRPDFWVNCSTICQSSKTGFLGVGTYNSSTLGLRVARFGALI